MGTLHQTTSRATRRLAELLAALACAGALAHSGPHDPPTAKTGAEAGSPPVIEGTRDARSYFTDSPLLTQDGRAVRFYSDVLADRVVLINVVFTHCEDACPLITQKLEEVRERLGARFGKDVHFISLSIDPQRDTPQALKAFARQQGADVPGWTFLTGAPSDIERVLARLGQLTPTVEAHSTLLIAGNVGAKRWSKIRPDAPVSAIAERLRQLADTP